MADGDQAIPNSLKFAFQEYQLDQLSLEADAFTIIERTLAWGNRAELRWLFNCYGKERLQRWLGEGGWRTLPRRRLILWTTYFDLPPFPPKKNIWMY